MGTYTSPKLIQIATPIFSFACICNLIITSHGINARIKSMAAEYAAAKMPYRKRASGSQHEPGMAGFLSINVGSQYYITLLDNLGAQG